MEMSQFRMDTGAECNVQPLNVYQQVTGDKELKKLNKNKDSVLVLANGMNSLANTFLERAT